MGVEASTNFCFFGCAMGESYVDYIVSGIVSTLWIGIHAAHIVPAHGAIFLRGGPENLRLGKLKRGMPQDVPLIF